MLPELYYKHQFTKIMGLRSGVPVPAVEQDMSARGGASVRRCMLNIRRLGLRYIHTCMHACIHTYIHTYIHTRLRRGSEGGGLGGVRLLPGVVLSPEKFLDMCFLVVLCLGLCFAFLDGFSELPPCLLPIHHPVEGVRVELRPVFEC